MGPPPPLARLPPTVSLAFAFGPRYYASLSERREWTEGFGFVFNRVPSATTSDHSASTAGLRGAWSAARRPACRRPMTRAPTGRHRRDVSAAASPHHRRVAAIAVGLALAATVAACGGGARDGAAATRPRAALST